jgi:hypothetical protein
VTSTVVRSFYVSVIDVTMVDVPWRSWLHEDVLLSVRRARASDQLPLVIVMVLFTVGGLGLLFGF